MVCGIILYSPKFITMKKLFFTLALTTVLGFASFSQQIINGIRVSYYVTDAQIEFINRHYNYVITPYLSDEIRNKIVGPELLLYRSIQGVWENFSQFDYDFINSNENMFCHTDSLIQDTSTRILTIWGSWLMDGNDFVDPDEPDALHHWINYYAITASGQVITFSYDGLFIDSAGHKIGPGALYGKMPWDYSDTAWRNGRYAALAYIKSKLPDNLVIFNGLHSDNGADSSLNFTDGGMWEDFTYDINDGHYKGIDKWLKAINCMESNHDSSRLVLVIKKPELTNDIQARVFSTASFLLISNQNTALSLSDYAQQNTLQYYPEYEIDLGAAVSDLEITDDSLFIRTFEKGKVIVNPNETETKNFETEKKYYKIIPSGGGVIDTTLQYDGFLTYELPDTSTMTIPPVSALILMDTAAAGQKEHKSNIDFLSVKNVYPNPFFQQVNINLHVSKTEPVKVAVYNIQGAEIQRLFEGTLPKGNHHFKWNGRLSNNQTAAPGLYLLKVSTNGRSIVKKLLKAN